MIENFNDPTFQKVDMSKFRLPSTNANPPMPKVNKTNEKLSYSDLRDEIHKILYEFLEWELECNKGGEFDFEWMEYKTDDILRLIKNQGGSTV